MEARGHTRAGTALVVVVTLVCGVALAAHLTRYAALLTDRRDGRARTATAAAPTGSALHVDRTCRRPDNPPTSAHIPAGDPYGTDLAVDGPGAELQRLYAVSGGTLTPLDGAGPVRPCDAQVWALVTAVADPAVLGVLHEFLVFDSDLGPGAGGSTASSDAGPVVGEVSAKGDTDASSWRLSIAPNATGEVELAIDVAHEVGHLATLASDQLGPGTEDTCPTYWTGEGCLRDDATMLAFLDDTWSDAEVREFNDAVDPAKTDDEVDAALSAFYDQHAHDFVTDYAASDPAEDVAESFAYWCVFGVDNPRAADYVTGDPTDGAAKIAWFDDTSHGVAASFAPGCARLRALTH